MNWAWIIGTVIAAVGAVAALVPVWRGRSDGRGNLTLKHASLTGRGAVRVSIANAGRGPALHAEVAVRKTRESVNEETAWVEFIASDDEQTADLVVSHDLLCDDRAVFHLSWDDADGKHREKISKRGVRAALSASRRRATTLDEPKSGWAFVYDDLRDRAWLGPFHGEILERADLKGREGLVFGYVSGGEAIHLYDWGTRIPDAQRRHICAVVVGELRRVHRAE
ncbi:MAG TPA: hypothetical protein VFJ93_02445 [Gaiellaceae bacterium]|nr:hypothetical protein [Gaiellaceae bacterium]